MLAWRTTYNNNNNNKSNSVHATDKQHYMKWFWSFIIAPAVMLASAENLRGVQRALDPADDYYKTILIFPGALTVNFPDLEISLDYQGSVTTGIEYEAVIFDDGECKDPHQLAITSANADDPVFSDPSDPKFGNLIADEIDRPFGLTVDTTGGDPKIQITLRPLKFINKGTDPYPQYWDQPPESITATLNICVQLQIFHKVDETTRNFVNFVDVHVNVEFDMQEGCDPEFDPTCTNSVTVGSASVAEVTVESTADYKLYAGPCLAADETTGQGRSVDICVWVDPVESPGVCLMEINTMALKDGATTYSIFPSHTGIDVFDNLASATNCDDLNLIEPTSTELYPQKCGVGVNTPAALIASLQPGGSSTKVLSVSGQATLGIGPRCATSRRLTSGQGKDDGEALVAYQGMVTFLLDANQASGGTLMMKFAMPALAGLAGLML